MRKAVLFGLGTIIFLVVLVFLGIPALIKGAIFFSDLKSSSTPIEQNDIFAPNTPLFNALPEYSKEQSLTISGFAEAGSTVELFLNGSPTGTTVSTNEGTFTFTMVKLPIEKNDVYAQASDLAGNKSQPSQKSTITFDNTAPNLEIFSPQDSVKVVGERKRKITISGQTEENVTLTVNERLVIINQDGSFSFEYNLAEGDNSLKFIAEDLAENKSEKEIKVTFII